ncbi:MAG TPA: glycine cleavage T C-terminal barrel domain-containing protein, partial [Actinomycetales bacterium]
APLPDGATDGAIESAPALPPSPLLQRPGAVAGEGVDAAVAWHYGDPVREQRLLVEGLAVVDLSHRAVVTVTGPQRLTWLHSITTQNLSALEPRTSSEALVLSPKGHVEHALHVVDDGTTTWLTAEPGTGPALTRWLQSMQFMLRVETTDRTADFAVIGEPIAGEGLEGEPPVWRDPWPAVAAGSVSYAQVDDGEHPGRERAWREVVVPRDQLPDVVGDRPLAGTWAGEALRVQAWRPRLGHETDHRTIPHEVDWLRTAVHLTKGCYRGQETVARVHNLGRPPRRLVMLHLDGSGHLLPARGSDVLAGERRVGHLTSVARHHELGPIGLALVKRSLPTDAELLVDGVSAAQEVVVRP